MLQYAVIDLETTGLDPVHDRILEIGVMRVGGAVCDREPLSLLVRQEQPIPPQIQQLTGLTDLEVQAKGVRCEVALPWFLGLIGDLPLVGHNVLRFDRLFLLEAIGRWDPSLAALGPLAEHQFVDTAALYKAYKLGLRPAEGERHWTFARRVLDTRVRGLKYNLKLACEDLGVETFGAKAHRAATDILMCQRLYERLLAGGFFD